MNKAVDVVREEKLPHFADLANLLFPALPFPSEIKATELTRYDAAYERLSGILTRINGKRIGVKWEHLQKIPSVTVIAGGKYKRYTLWTLLLSTYLDGVSIGRNLRIISDLVTDEKTANKLLDELNGYKITSDNVRAWYESKVQQLFSSFTESQTRRERAGKVSGPSEKA